MCIYINNNRASFLYILPSMRASDLSAVYMY